MDIPRDVFLGALRSISEIGTLDYDRKGLAGIESEVRKAVNMLKRYGDGSMDQILTAFLELKMTAKFRQEWISYHGRPKCVPHIEDLLNFANKRQSILELPHFSKEFKTMTNSKTAIGNFTTKANRGMVMQTKGTTVTCSACDAVHHLFQCSTFCGWDLERRKNFIKIKHLCYNCLGHGHISDSCPSKKLCSVWTKASHIDSPSAAAAAASVCSTGCSNC